MQSAAAFVHVFYETKTAPLNPMQRFSMVELI